MTPKNVEYIKNRDGHSILRTDDSMGFNNYVVVNESNKDYYNVSVAKNTTLNEVKNEEVYYTIKENGVVVKGDIHTFLPKSVIKVLVNEVETYVDQSNHDEVVDYMVDSLNSVGYRPRHVIHYDDVEDTLDYEFLIIVNGGLDTFYVSIEKNGDIYHVDDESDRHLLGNMDSPDEVQSQIEFYLNDMEHFTSMINEEMVEDAIIESFNQQYGVVVTEGVAKIFNKESLEDCGYIDRKNGIYRLSEDIQYVGKDRLKHITEQIEVNQLLTEEVDVESGNHQLRMFSEYFLDKTIKLETDTFKGEVVFTNPRLKTMTFLGEPRPTIYLDVIYVKVDWLKNLIPGEDDTVFNFNESPELLTIFEKILEVVKSDQSFLLTIRKSFEEQIERKLKYFGLVGYKCYIKQMSLA